MTVVIVKRKSILTDNIDLLRQSFKDIKNHDKFEIYSIVILPDHFHMIVKTENIKEYPRVIFLIIQFLKKS